MAERNFNSVQTATVDKGWTKEANRVHVPYRTITEAESLNLSSNVTLTKPSILYANTGGTLVVDLYNVGEELTFTVDDGEFLNVLVTKVYSSSTAEGVLACR